MEQGISQFYRIAEPSTDDEVIADVVDICMQIASRRMKQKRRTYASFLPGCMQGVYGAEVPYIKPVAMECTRMMRQEPSETLIAEGRKRLNQELLATLTGEQKGHLHFLKATGGLHVAE